MEKIEIYFKSDFTVILASEAQWGGCPFRLSFYTASPSRSFVACYDGENYHNCRLLEDGRLEIAINQKDGNVQTLMGIGTLMCAPEFYLDNEAFKDHVCNQFVKPFVPTFRDEEGNEYQVNLSLNGVSTLVTYGTLPAFYQRGISEEERQAILKETAAAHDAADIAKAATLKADTAAEDAIIATDKANSATQAAQEAKSKANAAASYANTEAAKIQPALNKMQQDFNAAETERTNTFNSKEAERDAAVAEATKVADEVAAISGKVSELEGVTEGIDAQMEGDKYHITDKEGNILATFDKDGLHVVDIEILNNGRLVNIVDLLSGKVDKEEGKGLSTNDLTDELLAKIGTGSSIGSIIEDRPDALYITDSLGNVFLKISEEGINYFGKEEKDRETDTKSNPITCLSGKTLYVIGDSFCAGGIWQTKLAELTGLVFDQSTNINGFSWAGTSSINPVNRCGIARAKKLVEWYKAGNPVDFIICENVNDFGVSRNGSINDQPIRRNQEITHNGTFSSEDEAVEYFNNNITSILSGVTPKVGTYVKMGSSVEMVFKKTDSVEGFLDATNWGKYTTVITLYRAWKEIFETLLDGIPQAKIFMLIPSYISYNYTNPSKRADGTIDYEAFYNSQKFLRDFFETEREIAKYYNIPILDMQADSSINLLNAKDNNFATNGDIHPSTGGYLRWGETIARLLTGK